MGTSVGGPASTWSTSTPGLSWTRRGELRIVAARVDDDVIAEPGERRRQGGDVHVLAAGVDPAEHRQRARVLADHRDSHDATSIGTSTSSQSARKRSSP